MKIILTSITLGLALFIVGELQYWLNTSNWRSDDGGFTHTYSYKGFNRKLRWILDASGALVILSGMLVAIWTTNL